MESVRPVHRSWGLPRWVLWAASPAILALGFVLGIALATYLPAGSPPPPDKVTAPTIHPGDVAATGTAQPGPDVSWQIVSPSPLPLRNTTLPPVDAGDPKAPQIRPEPEVPLQAFKGAPADIREARLALLTDYARYSDGHSEFVVDYQQMRQAARGVSLVGLISISDYQVWMQALRENPDGLKRWLEGAARRTQSASARDPFHLSWAIVDVVRTKPEGFADYELIPLENRTYVVVRPLASTVDHTKAEVSLRPANSLEVAAAGQPVSATEPWAVYGPVLRFDETDLYRPLRASGQKPFKP